jgi:hypothetical protein
MYLLTEYDKWFIGRLHGNLDHDCSLTNKGFCYTWEALEVAYCETKDEESERLKALLGMQGEGAV